MNDTDSANPFEPPKQLTVPSAPSIGDPIPYDCTPTIDDLNAALRSISSIAFGGVWVLVLGLVSIALLTSLIIGQIQGIQYWSSLVVALVFVWFSAWNLIPRINAAKVYLTFNPHALARLSGELNKDGLLLKSERRVSWQSHAGLEFFQNKNRQLILSYDSQAAVVKILPVRGFQRPTVASGFLEQQAQNNSTTLDMLQPVTGPCMIGEQPADAIAFSGFLKAGDLKTSPLETIRKRNLKRLAIWMVALTLIPLPLMAAFGFDWQTTFIACTVILSVVFLTVYTTFRSGGAFPDPEQPLIAIQGWITEQEVALLHNIGQSRSGWRDFRQVGFNDTCIWLLAHGGKNRFVLLQRRFFADDFQWQTAVSLAHSQIQQSAHQ